MTSFSLKCKAIYNARSISLPSRSHPLTQKLEEQLYLLSSFEPTSTFSSSSIENNLAGLKDLHTCVDDLLQLPLVKKLLGRERSDKCVNEVLDGTLRIVDICSIGRDVLLLTKECIQDLQSALRRRRGEETCFENEVSMYISSRKQVNKAVHKCVGELKRVDHKLLCSTPFEKDDELVAVVGVLRKVEDMSLSILESLLLFVACSRTRSKTGSGWSLVSKLMQTKRESGNICEMDILDTVLSELINNKSPWNGIESSLVISLQKQLEALQVGIEGLEVVLETVYKNVIKTRVSLLNILSQ